MIDQITGYAAWCDTCGAEFEAADGWHPVFDSEQEAREALREAGWAEVQYGKWECPDCHNED